MISPTTATPTDSNATDLVARLAAREQRIGLLEEENRWLKRQLFGRSSEKLAAEDVSPDQQWLFNEVEALAKAAEAASQSVGIPAHERRKRGRKPLGADLPRVEVVHDLTEAQKVCPHDGTALVRIGEESAEQLHFRPAEVCVIRTIRPKYACPCCHQAVHLAPVPPQLLPKSLATPSLLAQIATAKFVDGLPLYRQEPQFHRLGVPLGRATMAGWMIQLGATHVVPVINLMNEILLDAPLIHCDETRLQVLKSDKAPTADHWMWVRAAGPPGRRIILFDYDASRGGEVPKRLLEGYRGILLTDGYRPYDLAAQALKLVHAGCLAHARRYFEAAHKASTNAADGHARVALQFIRELYGIERALTQRDTPCTPEERLQARAQRSAPIIARFHAWLEDLAPRVLPESLLGKAVFYTLGQWTKLIVFLNHAEAPLDNNRCENAIRPFVIGRKGWLFSDTVAGARASANLYSLVETAKANGVEPHAYLSRLFERLPLAKTVEDFEALLPWNLKPELPASHLRAGAKRKDVFD
ncbi:MAG: IS66 family transposase [Burkholderiales bacterium]